MYSIIITYMDRQERIRKRVNEILGSGVVQISPQYYSGTGVVQESPQYYSGTGVVQQSPQYYSGTGVVQESPQYYSGTGHTKKQCPHCNGTGFFDDLWSGIKDVGKTIIPIVGPLAIKALTGMGKNKKAPSKRNQMIKAVMQKNPGMTLGNASKFLKQNGY
jgi:hypothetical protein